MAVPLWIAGGIVDAEALRWGLWLAALGIDLAGPIAAYWLPGAGTTPMSQWQIEGAHFGERFQLFVIIALGESIVLAGATASDTGLSAESSSPSCSLFSPRRSSGGLLRPGRRRGS